MSPMAKKKIRYLNLSVHELVDLLLREGDIDNRVYNFETMQLGSKIHASFQEKQGNSYLSEVQLSETFSRPGAEVTLSGRADGIIVGGPFPIIDEIKSSVLPLEKFYKEQKNWHLGQAECYALMYLHENKLEKAGVRLTYISQIDGSSMKKENVFTLEELENKVYGIIDDYIALTQEEEEHIEKRNQSAQKLAFPYDEFRAGQREMAKYCYSVATKGGIFFCEAPTGIGKTMSALYPSVKAFGKGKISKIFYLTAKSSGRDSAFEAMALLYKKGFVGRDSVLTAKDKICFSPGKNCNPDECPFAKDYYSKLREGMGLAAKRGIRFDNPSVTSLAFELRLCPFEFQLDLSLLSDVIICDFNYFFDPFSKLQRYFDEMVDSSFYLVLVDEAHNLISRGRDMYSEEIPLSLVSQARKSISSLKGCPKAKSSLSSLSKALRNLDLENGDKPSSYQTIPPVLQKPLESLQTASRSLSKSDHAPRSESYKEITRRVYRLLTLEEEYAPSSLLYARREGSDFLFRLDCLDPSKMLAASLKKVFGAAIFSATLSPISYYMDAIMGSHEYPYLLLPSPFPKKNFSLIIAPMVSTRYKEREKTYPEVAAYLREFVSSRQGNYFIYFPSYDYLDKITPFLSFPGADVFTQEKDMSDLAKTDFLEHFVPHPSKTSVGLLIIGGAFSEGIDLPDDRLIGVAVVGIGLPQLSYERDLLKNYYQSLNHKGFEYAYMNPGVNKVMQAVGRLIRGENDVGAALLIDDRYARNDYRDLFSRAWKGYEIVTTPTEVGPLISKFYNGWEK